MNKSNEYINFKEILTRKKLAGLWQLLQGYHGIYITAMVMQALSALSKTATYLLLQFFVDNYLISQDSEIKIWLIATGFIGLSLFQGLATFLSQRLAAQTSEGTIRRLRNFLYDHIQRLSFSFHAKSETGDLIQRSTSDVDAIRRFFSDQAVGVGRIVLLFLINFIALLRLNTKLALYSVIVVPIVIYLSLFFFGKVSKAYKDYQEQDAILSTTLQENLSGVRVVKAFARQRYEINKFEKDNREKYVRGKKLLTIHSFYWPISDIFCGAQLVFGFLTGALMTVNGEISIGTYLAYAGMVIWIIYPLRGLGRMIVQMSNGLVSFERIFKIIQEEREPLDKGTIKTKNEMKGKIEFRNVSFHYEDGTKVLDDISFTCKPGMSIALLGSTGSGKTTLINLLPRFYELSEGAILLDEIDLRLYSKHYLRERIGIVEQEPFLFSRSIFENITYGLKSEITQEKVEEAAKAASIHDVILTFPEGYKTLVGERGVTLSGGQKQRIAIARTFIKDPRILILDDSTSSVDAETETEIRESINRLMENRTTFIIAHRVQSVMNADLILVMDKGHIVQEGTHQDLVKQEGIYQKIFNIQTQIEEELEQEISRVS